MENEKDFKNLLKSQGLNVTSARVAILKSLDECPHADAETVLEHARKKAASLSRQAVYDNLSALSEKGLIRMIQPMGHPARYETRVGDNHHHVICRSCGKASDVDCAVNQRPCLNPSKDHGFSLDEAEIIFWGVCPDCQNSNKKGKNEHEQT